MPPSVEQTIQGLESRFPSNLYLYRGQSELFPSKNRVPSTLYRLRPDGHGTSLLALEQRALLLTIPSYSPHTLDIEIMANLRHFEGPTNFIDFTSNILVALFFACFGNPKGCGQLLFLPIDRGKSASARDYDRSTLFRSLPQDDIKIFRDFHTERNVTRAVRQSSVLVRSAAGYIDFNEDETYTLSSVRKQDIMKFLRRHHSYLTLPDLLPDRPGFIEAEWKEIRSLKDLEEKWRNSIQHRAYLLQKDESGYRKGQELLFHGYYEQAADFFLAMLEEERPANWDVDFRRFLGSALLRAGRCEEALEALAGIPWEDWTHEEHFVAALSGQGLGDLSGALADIKRAIAGNRSRSNYYIAEMQIAEQAGRHRCRRSIKQSHEKLFHSKHGKNSPLW